MRSLFIITAVATSALLASTAEAADNGLYFGASVGQTTAHVQAGGQFDADDRGFKLIGGLRAFDRFGIEASYVDFGKVKQTHNNSSFADFRFDQTGFDAFGVFFYEIATFDLFAKAGVVRWDVDASGRTGTQPVSMSENGTDFAWALGAQARLGSLALRLEYERLELKALDGWIQRPRMLSLGLTWTLF